MHILLITQYWHPEQGVVQRRWEWLSKAILEAGHTLTVVTPPPHYPGGKLTSDKQEHQRGNFEQPGDRLTIYRTNFREHSKSITSRVKDQATIMLSSFFVAKKAIKKAKKQRNQVDVVCCTVPALPSALVSWLIAKRFHKPLVIELRDAWPELLINMEDWSDHRKRPTRPIKRFRRWVLHFILQSGGRALNSVLKSADLVITTTKSLADLEIKKGIKSVETIPNRPDYQLPIITNHIKSPNSPLNVLYAGTIGRAQGLSNAVYAARIAKDKGVCINLTLVGGGAHVDRIKALAAKLQVPITMPGRVSFNDINKYYSWCDTVLVHLESWKTMELTIPSKLFEALRLKKHITGALAGEASDIIIASGAGHTVPPMNPKALAELWISLSKNPCLLDVSNRGVQWLESLPSPAELAGKWITSVERVSNIEDSQ
ncbi:hypothetical protein BSR28_01955 [Boudabousia liubingyangii]|uniref:glycosyltransferase family 4 protein n=1 Tax=Boudabousia liubingyangii TaxID=1921764 RepID=UPI0009400FED|nr:glycosyltransferase family 4 protein [Boudabousia liubingyangii]OKL48482.1 hypothetical protein BSR28_01955 [Boudabousia liubingyangii]